MVRHALWDYRITEESTKKPELQIRHLKCTGSPGSLVGSQQSQKKKWPRVLHAKSSSATIQVLLEAFML